MTKTDDIPAGTIRFDLTITEQETLRCAFKYNLEGLPEDAIPFFHRFMEGMMLLLNNPEEIAQVAVDAHMASGILSSITDSMTGTTEDDTSEISANVLTFPGRLQ